MKYLIMEVQLSYAVGLDEEGRFVKMPNMGYEVGQTVEDAVVFDDPLDLETDARAVDGALPSSVDEHTSLLADAPASASPRRRAGRALRRRFAIFAAAASMFVFAVTGYAVWQTSVGTVRMRINPAMSMSVNRFDRVVDLRGDNADGDNLIDGYGYYGKNVQDVSQDLVERAREQGYLKPGGLVRIDADSNNAAWADAIARDLLAALTDAFDGDADIELDEFVDDELDVDDDADDAGDADDDPADVDDGDDGDDSSDRDSSVDGDDADYGDSSDSDTDVDDGDVPDDSDAPDDSDGPDDGDSLDGSDGSGDDGGSDGSDATGEGDGSHDDDDAFGPGGDDGPADDGFANDGAGKNGGANTDDVDSGSVVP
ncbi:hypothetical protein [Collinsella tanakaei]|uniref:anti-sigma-I factor RsgI family protein n=1 Tax=Collinsella tanakaei TaxID=626935 RepID=UPI0022E70D32|nr:hypothetical protein [Collinsella tanakaei]